MSLTKDELIIYQGEKIKELQNKIYEIQITGEIPNLNHDIRQKKSFKKFIKDREDLKSMVSKQLIKRIDEMKRSMQKMERIIKANNLDKQSVSLHKTSRNYIRIAMFLNVQELLNEITSCQDEFYTLPNGYKVKPSSLRYQTFVGNLECVKCGLKGSFLALEKCLSDFGGNEKLKDGSGFHLNLYALDNICDYKELKYNKQFFVMSHYPMLTWNKKHFGSIHLYGHVHDISLGEYENNLCHCVCVEKNNYVPISLDEIIRRLINE